MPGSTIIIVTFFQQRVPNVRLGTLRPTSLTNRHIFEINYLEHIAGFRITFFRVIISLFIKSPSNYKEWTAYHIFTYVNNIQFYRLFDRLTFWSTQLQFLFTQINSECDLWEENKLRLLKTVNMKYLKMIKKCTFVYKYIHYTPSTLTSSNFNCNTDSVAKLNIILFFIFCS